MANTHLSSSGGSHSGSSASRGGTQTIEIIPVQTGRFSTPISNAGFVDYANKAAASTSSAPQASTPAVNNYGLAQQKVVDDQMNAYQEYLKNKQAQAPSETIKGGTSSSSGSSSSSGYVAPTVDTSAIDDNYNEMQRYMQEMYERQRAQQEAEYQNALGKLANSYEQGKSNLNQNSDDALRQAYINYMMGKRNLNQDLANRGINGGATESVLSQLYNNYGGNRAAIDKERTRGLADLAQQYNQNVAEAGANYGGDYTDLLNNYYNSMIGLRENYASDLANMMKNAASVSARTSASANSAQSMDETPNPWGNYSEKDIVSTISKLANNPSAIASYLNRFGDASEDDRYNVLYQAGLDPTAIYRQNVANTTGTANNNATTPTVLSATQRYAIKDELQRIMNGVGMMQQSRCLLMQGCVSWQISTALMKHRQETY